MDTYTRLAAAAAIYWIELLTGYNYYLHLPPIKKRVSHRAYARALYIYRSGELDLWLEDCDMDVERVHQLVDSAIRAREETNKKKVAYRTILAF